jgi:hypothetical protein
MTVSLDESDVSLLSSASFDHSTSEIIDHHSSVDSPEDKSERRPQSAQSRVEVIASRGMPSLQVQRLCRPQVVRIRAACPPAIKAGTVEPDGIDPARMPELNPGSMRVFQVN